MVGRILQTAIIAFFVASVGLDPVIFLFEFRMLLRFDEGIGSLDRKRIQIAVGAKNIGRFYLAATLVIARAVPISAKEKRCFDDGNMDMSGTIKEKMAMTGIGFLPNWGKE